MDDGRLIPSALRVLRRNPLVWLFAGLGHVGGYLLEQSRVAPTLFCGAALVWVYAYGLSVMGVAIVLRRSYLDQTAELKTTFREANGSLWRFAGVMALIGLAAVVPFLCFRVIARSLAYAHVVLLMGLLAPYFALLLNHVELAVITTRVGVGATAKIGLWHWNHDRVPKLILALANSLLFFLMTTPPLIQAKGLTAKLLATGWQEALALKETPMMALVSRIYGLLFWLLASAMITVLHMRRVGRSPAERAAAAAGAT